MIKIEKNQTNTNTRHKYAVFTVYEKGDWSAFVDYEKVKILSQNQMDGETCVLDVRTIEIKGQKRKLLLADRGDGPVVYTLEKSKLEDIFNVGFI